MRPKGLSRTRLADHLGLAGPDSPTDWAVLQPAHACDGIALAEAVDVHGHGGHHVHEGEGGHGAAPLSRLAAPIN